MKQNNISYTVKKIVCILLLIVFFSWNALMLLQSLYDAMEYGEWIKLMYDVCNLICGILLFICVFMIHKKSVKHIINIALGLFDSGICIFIVNVLIKVINASRYYDVDDYRYKYILFTGISDIVMYLLLLLLVSALIINLIINASSRRTLIFIGCIGLTICFRAILLALINNILIDGIDSFLEIILANLINEIPIICLCITLLLLTSMKDKIYLPRQLVSDPITVNSMELKSQNESGMLSDEDYLEKKQDIQDSLNSQNIQCRETQNKFESENKTSKSTKLKKWIILAITVVVLTAIIVSIVVNYINENTYKIDMDYTQDSIEHFIEGIEENGDYYGISISDIDVDEDIAIADLYVEKYFNKPVEIRLIFEYGYDGTSTKKRYTLSITHFSSYSEIIDIETAVSVAESVELMLTGETKIQEGHNTNYNSDNWDSFDTYRHQFDGYNVEYHYSYVTKDSFHYKIKFFYR